MNLFVQMERTTALLAGVLSLVTTFTGGLPDGQETEIRNVLEQLEKELTVLQISECAPETVHLLMRIELIRTEMSLMSVSTGLPIVDSRAPAD